LGSGVLKHRPLLDVELDVRGDRVVRPPCVAKPMLVAAGRVEQFRQCAPHPDRVRQLAGVHTACHGPRTEHRRRAADALLIAERRHNHRMLQGNSTVVPRLGYFNCREHAVRSVVRATTRHGVQM
jgi:hypothetical protein